MSQYKTKRLTNDKKKTNNSYQNKLSPKEIKEKLEEYKRVDDITTISLNAHLKNIKAGIIYIIKKPLTAPTKLNKKILPYQLNRLIIYDS